MRQIALGLTLSLLLGACGTKGPLYQLPRQEAQTPLFVKAGEKLGVVPAPAAAPAVTSATTPSTQQNASPK